MYKAYYVQATFVDTDLQKRLDVINERNETIVSAPVLGSRLIIITESQEVAEDYV